MKKNENKEAIKKVAAITVKEKTQKPEIKSKVKEIKEEQKTESKKESK
jgi:hypothetical protein